LPISTSVADDNAGITAGASINQLILSNIPAENKIAVLIYAYGFKQAEAQAMVSA